MKLEKMPFGTADILLPNTESEKWACVACDQFTSNEEYWQAVKAAAGEKPSTLNLIYPEVYLGKTDESGCVVTY